MLNLNTLAEECYDNSVNHGFYDKNRDSIGLIDIKTVNAGEKIALMHGELSEALEELRSGRHSNEVYYNEGSDKPEGVPIELADCIIRILDFCGLHNINIDAAVRSKMTYNATRPHMHGRKF